jgi:hypothetical protein
MLYVFFVFKYVIIIYIYTYYLCNYLFIYSFMYIFIYLFILSIYLSIYLFIYLFIYFVSLFARKFLKKFKGWPWIWLISIFFPQLFLKKTDWNSMFLFFSEKTSWKKLKPIRIIRKKKSLNFKLFFKNNRGKKN